jgi:hypothetical protein
MTWMVTGVFENQLASQWFTRFGWRGTWGDALLTLFQHPGIRDRPVEAVAR